MHKHLQLAPIIAIHYYPLSIITSHIITSYKYTPLLLVRTPTTDDYDVSRFTSLFIVSDDKDTDDDDTFLLLTATTMMIMPTTMQMIMPIITMVMIVLSTMTPNVCVVSAFHNSVVSSPSSPRQSSYIRLKSISRSSSDSTTTTTTTTTNVIVDKLIQQVIIDDGKEGAVDPTNTTNQKNLRDTSIRDLMTDLSSIQQVSNTSTNEDLFGPLLGYYNVSYTLTENPNDNPVGGKWTRSLWTVKRTLQHVLPPLPSSEEEDDDEKGKTVKATVVAQVVNAIKLDCLWGFVGIWVLLRGDAVPLKDDQEVKNIKEEESNGTKNENKKNKKSPRKLLPDLTDRTVRVYFDQPKIGISLFRKTSLLNNDKNKNKKKLLSQRVLNLGPTSSVVLDTPYNDNRIRLGKGGTSGSQFVFCRINDDDNIDIDAKEGWKWMLDDNKIIGRSLTKKKLMLRLGILTFVFSLSYRIIQHQYRWMKIGAGISSIISCMSMLWLSMSTGGIETRGNSFSKGRG